MAIVASLSVKINSGFYARKNSSEATISESSQIRELATFIDVSFSKKCYNYPYIPPR